MVQATYIKGGIECLYCGLHFVVLKQTLGKPTAFALTCPECHQGGQFLIARRWVNGLVFHPDPPGMTTGNPDEPHYTQVACQCLDCSLDFVIATWHPERHHEATLACPRCAQAAGHFQAARRTVPGFIYKMVPGPGGWTDA
jgi:Zn finger protein HypA/HybF involved in hydrogenase expression